MEENLASLKGSALVDNVSVKGAVSDAASPSKNVLRSCPERPSGLPSHAQSGRVWINGGRAMSSPVVRSRNALKRHSMRFAAALLSALASVAGPNAALAAARQHHDQVPGFYRLKVGDLAGT